MKLQRTIFGLFILAFCVSCFTPTSTPSDTSNDTDTPTDTGTPTDTTPTTSTPPAGVQGVVTTLSGIASSSGSTTGLSSTGSPGVNARFNYPKGVCSDGTNLYIADSSNHVIRKVVIATGEVTTLAGYHGTAGSTDGTGSAALFNTPIGIDYQSSYLYVADFVNYTIRKINVNTAVVTTLAGFAGVSALTDGVGAAARFKGPVAVTVVGTTTLYVADYPSHAIRRVEISDGTVTTIAGDGTLGHADGAGSSATFNCPQGIVAAGTTDLYVSDTGNHTIRRIILSGAIVSTLAGTATSSGSADGTGISASFNAPEQITYDGTNLFIADVLNSTIRKIVVSSSVVSTLAGTAGSNGTTDGIGSVARFYHPRGIHWVLSNLYVSDTTNQTIRKIVPGTGVVTTLAGAASISGFSDGTFARYNSPQGITGGDGTYLYVADTNNHVIRKVASATGISYPVAGLAGTSGTADGTGLSARFNQPWGIVYASNNIYYVADTFNHAIRKIDVSLGDATVSTFAGAAGSSGTTDGTGGAARFDNPYGIVSDGTNLYVSDSGNHTIRQIVISSGAVTTLAGVAGSAGSADGTGSAARFATPTGLTLNGSDLYVMDQGNHTIRKVVVSSGAVTTFAGTVGVIGSADGTGTAAQFYNIFSCITNDGTYLYVADSGNYTIRKILISSGAVTTIAGTANSFGTTDGTGAAARFNYPRGIVHLDGKLYVVDAGNHIVRKIE
ncbi:MAG: hypothetical protein WCT14_00320 [Treponemataceae bacterium]